MRLQVSRERQQQVTQNVYEVKTNGLPASTEELIRLATSTTGNEEGPGRSCRQDFPGQSDPESKTVQVSARLLGSPGSW